ncbi:MAG TPA: hypothetical protein DEG17_11615 [Cyanobacteria bacterium UBA11149]|nr:hypothetical protein [Cyanobacteria bacterium UBA11366]HBK62925.1 hypothetical protein [Cyanobacteria bacterium UBA11166]HBR74882.1 hypothetical protein [Cyanobacteria bacterium UBA11159]HBS70890.1 hypothetical protein [Cyanobacteria bacterium UBA11153]HBW89495.1 hypothetical protein [Cyanobacteria bacterium UBA11149]
MSIHIFGIRHHGPGSGYALLQALETLQPDAILVEGPPDGDGVLPLLVHPEMKPPVALIVYRSDLPRQAVYYPFAVFSPEWQALQYGLTHGVAVRFMDLPQTHQFGLTALTADIPEDPNLISTSPSQIYTQEIQFDPLGWLGKAAGYPDGESWWEDVIEQRQDSTDLFTAILEAMTVLRQEIPPLADPIEAKREAYMRKIIRTAQKEGFEKIAVVCGAWHAPVLAEVKNQKSKSSNREKAQEKRPEYSLHSPLSTSVSSMPLPTPQEDNTLLKGMPKIKVEVTWIPWTYSRLSYQSGYGAGIKSPGWYDHLWHSKVENRDGADFEDKLSMGGEVFALNQPRQNLQNSCPTSHSDLVIRWMIKVAQLLREEGLDASPANLIDAVRLAESLAGLRDRTLPGLPELNEATQTVLCFGSDIPMGLIRDKLIVGERLGAVPDETPMVPLQQDLQRLQKRLRMPAEATEKVYELDLRKENDLARSQLLHRLNLLAIPWGILSQKTTGQGTFKEKWRVRWQPEFAVKLIEAGIWGNTIVDAATALSCNLSDGISELPGLTRLLNLVLLADLPDAVAYLMNPLQNKVAVTSDVAHLMGALPPLANILRYGNVRHQDRNIIRHVVDGLVARICIGLPGCCYSLDDDAATKIYQLCHQVNSAISLLSNPDYKTAWHKTLTQLANIPIIHGLLSGYSCRLLLDGNIWNTEEVSRRMGLALSLANQPAQSGAWIEGFLTGSGLLLIHDAKLWQVLDNWVTQLKGDTFITLLPLLRRTFATFSLGEKRQIGAQVKRGDLTQVGKIVETDRDCDRLSNDTAPHRADTVLPILAQLLGLTSPTST